MKKSDKDNELNLLDTEKKMLLKMLKQQYENCKEDETALINEKKRRICLSKLVSLKRSEQYKSNQLSYVIKLYHDISYYDSLITYHSEQKNDSDNESIKLQSILIQLIKSNKAKAEYLMQETLEILGVELEDITKLLVNIQVKPQPIFMAQINEIAEAFFNSNENALNVDELIQLAEILSKLKIELEAQENDYHEYGHTSQELRTLYDVKMLLSSIHHSVKKLIIKKT